MNFLNIFLFFRVPFFKHSLCANFFEQRYCTCLTIVNVWLKIRFLCFCDIFDQNKAKIKCKFILQNSTFLLWGCHLLFRNNFSFTKSCFSFNKKSLRKSVNEKVLDEKQFFVNEKLLRKSR